MHTHTHTHTARGVLESGPRVWDKTLGEPEESKWTKSKDTYIRECVPSARAYKTGWGLDLALTALFF